jgi:hypothetical protein
MTVAADLPSPPSERRKAAIDPAVVQGIRQASRETHVDFGYLMAEAQQESGFQPDAKATTSSATGLYQFTDATWLDMVRQHGAQHGIGQLAQQVTTNAAGHPTVADPATRAQILGLRKDPGLSASLAAELAKSNKEEVERALGRPAHSADLYLAHFLGAGGATELLKAIQQNGSKPAADLLPEAAAANRAVFYDPQSGAPRTVSDIYRSLASRVEQNAADYSPASTGPTTAAAGGGGMSSWSPGMVPGRSTGTQIASVFNAMFMTALKLLGGSSASQGDVAALGVTASSQSHHRDDRTT